MARPAKLIPRFDHKRGKWVLNIPSSLSPDGQRQRLTFDRGNEEEAKEHARRLKEGKEHFKDKAKGIRADLMEAAVKWNEVVIELGFHGLDHFCSVKVAELEKASAAPALSELLTVFENDHSKNWSAGYKSKRWLPFRRKLGELEDLKISQLDEAFWRDWLATWMKADNPGPDNYNQTLGMIRSFFELTPAKHVFPINPLNDLPGMKDRGKRSKPVSSPEDVQKLLLAAWEHDREMVPYFATCYFAGPRPDSEAKALHFEHFDWEEGHLKIGITKTNHAPNRYVPIEDALREWMRPWMNRKGSIIPSNFTRRRHRLIYGAYTTPGASLMDKDTWTQLVPWGHDISRHSYGSYWEAAHRGEDGCREKIVAHMGHENFKTFNRYYLNARSRKEAEAYWASRPTRAASA